MIAFFHSRAAAQPPHGDALRANGRRPPRFERVRVFGVAAGLVISAVSVARAEITKDQCVDANAKGQELRREGKLVAAGEQLRMCAKPACPGIVREDCAKRLGELLLAQPTLVFEMKDTAGSDVLGVAVSVDGELLTKESDGKPVSVDAGKRVFTFSAPGHETIVRTFLVAEGVKGRRERIILAAAREPAPPRVPPPVPEHVPAAPAVSAPAPAAARPTPAAPPAVVVASAPESLPLEEAPKPKVAPTHLGVPKMLGLSAGALGAVSVGVGGAFGLLAIAARNSQAADCGTGPSCANRSAALTAHSNEVTYGGVSTGAFVGGGALLAVGAVLFLLPTPKGEKAAAPAMRVVPTVGSSGGSLFLMGAF